MKQSQFLDVVERDEAERRWRRALDVRPLPPETVPIEQALFRVLAEDVLAALDVPGFDRSNMDGFAVRAEDTFGATEDAPLCLRLDPGGIPMGVAPERELAPGAATPIATGGMLRRRRGAAGGVHRHAG